MRDGKSPRGLILWGLAAFLHLDVNAGGPRSLVASSRGEEYDKRRRRRAPDHPPRAEAGSFYPTGSRVLSIENSEPPGRQEVA